MVTRNRRRLARIDCVVLARAVTVLALALTGCADRLIARTTIDVAARAVPAIEAESDPDLAEAAAPAGIVQLEGFYAAFGADRKLVTLLAEATCGYAAGFVADDAEDALYAGDRERAGSIARRARALLGRCARWALLGLGDRFAHVLDTDDATARALLASAAPDDAALLSWLGTAVAASIGAEPHDPGDAPLFALAPRAIAILERALALDDALDHGRAHVVVGALYAAQGAGLGGDPERGLAHLRRALTLSGGRLLLAKVMIARVYAVTTRDPERFDRELASVIATPASVWPEQRLANELARRKALRYQRHRDRWF